jgi:hypothetical protein
LHIIPVDSCASNHRSILNVEPANPAIQAWLFASDIAGFFSGGRFAKIQASPLFHHFTSGSLEQLERIGASAVSLKESSYVRQENRFVLAH